GPGADGRADRVEVVVAPRTVRAERALSVELRVLRSDARIALVVLRGQARIELREVVAGAGVELICRIDARLIGRADIASHGHVVRRASLHHLGEVVLDARDASEVRADGAGVRTRRETATH